MGKLVKKNHSQNVYTIRFECREANEIDNRKIYLITYQIYFLIG